jgi:ribonuclease III
MEPPQPRPHDLPARDPAVEALEAKLGLSFARPDVALAALTHKSFVNEHRSEGLADNERLEFLGDAVLDLAVSHRLMERFPVAREGELSKIRAAVVDEAGLARMARTLELGTLLRLGRGEELTGGRAKSSLLADAMEAVVAALYLGGGLEPVLALLDRFLGEAFARAAAGTLDRDYKTQLQELAQSRVRASPRYRVVAEHGPDHSKVFDVEAELKGEVVGRGTGRSKKDAEQAAAKLALEALAARLGEGTAVASAPEPASVPAVGIDGAATPATPVAAVVEEPVPVPTPVEIAVAVAVEPVPRPAEVEAPPVPRPQAPSEESPAPRKPRAKRASAPKRGAAKAKATLRKVASKATATLRKVARRATPAKRRS